MADVERIKAGVDMLALVGKDLALKKISGTRGGEYAGGPCPVCGSKHRVHVQPATGLFMVRCCHEHWGDAIEYVRWTRKVDFQAACMALGELPPLLPPRPQYVPTVDTAQAPEWEEAGLQIVTDCEEILWSKTGVQARTWLERRGFTEETMRAWRLGFNPDDGSDQLGGVRRGLRVWYGIVIPGMGIDGTLYYLKVRRLSGEPKYLHVKGSHPALIGQSGRWRRLLMCEGEFDAMLAWQTARDLCDVVTLGSATAAVGAWLLGLLRYREVFIVYDADEAGRKGAERLVWGPRCHVLDLPVTPEQGKDIGDYVKAGGDLRAWLSTEFERIERPPVVGIMRHYGELTYGADGYERVSGP